MSSWRTMVPNHKSPSAMEFSLGSCRPTSKAPVTLSAMAKDQLTDVTRELFPPKALWPSTARETAQPRDVLLRRSAVVWQVTWSREKHRIFACDGWDGGKNGVYLVYAGNEDNRGCLWFTGMPLLSEKWPTECDGSPSMLFSWRLEIEVNFHQPRIPKPETRHSPDISFSFLS